MTATNESSPLFSEAELNLASENYETQESLVEGLQQAFVMREMTIEQLAYELESSVDEAQAWIDGDVDLHLSELRHLANAIDAKVSYRVHPLRTRYEDRLQSMDLGFAWQTKAEWTAESSAGIQEIIQEARSR